MNYLARGPHCWGRATSRAEAVRLAAQNFPRGIYPEVKRPQDKHFSIFESEGDISICDFSGNVSSTGKIVKLQTSCLAT